MEGVMVRGEEKSDQSQQQKDRTQDEEIRIKSEFKVVWGPIFKIARHHNLVFSVL